MGISMTFGCKEDLVQNPTSGVGGRGSHADTPGAGIGNEDGGETGEDHCGDHGALATWREVDCEIGGGPVLEKERADEEDWDREKVVVEHG